MAKVVVAEAMANKMNTQLLYNASVTHAKWVGVLDNQKVLFLI
jgi:hypothetical protein